MQTNLPWPATQIEGDLDRGLRNNFQHAIVIDYEGDKMRSSMGYVARILVFLLLLAPFSVAQAPTIQILEGPELGGGEPTGVQLTVKWDAHGNPNYEQVSIHFELVPQEGGSEVSGTFQYQSSPGQDEFSIQFGETAAHAGDTIIVHATFTYSGGDPIPKSAQGEIPEEHEN